MKAINNQWQPPSAICLLIITLLPLLLLNWSHRAAIALFQSHLGSEVHDCLHTAKYVDLLSGATDRYCCSLALCIYIYIASPCKHTTL